MARIRKDFRYKLIENFLNKEELNLLRKYASYKLNNLSSANIIGSDTTAAPYCLDYARDDLMHTILESKTSLVEKETELKLFPTYAYWRWYPHGSLLHPHTDRPSCEISVTVNIYKTEDWPLTINDKKINVDSGQGVIYLGIEDKHSREGTYEGDGFAQLFLHYVDQNGFFAHHKHDKIVKRLGKTHDKGDVKLIEKLINQNENS
jgi:hypothetical protein|tara:strand:- start:3442 stop:4056 length:615 start_codon:yes stop_codon:yes gene_type:complete